jgi:hypothetical protein
MCRTVVTVERASVEKNADTPADSMPRWVKRSFTLFPSIFFVPRVPKQAPGREAAVR